MIGAPRLGGPAQAAWSGCPLQPIGAPCGEAGSVGRRDATGRDWLGSLPGPSSDPEEDTIGADAVRGTNPDVDSLGSPVSSSVAAESVFFHHFLLKYKTRVQ